MRMYHTNGVWAADRGASVLLESYSLVKVLFIVLLQTVAAVLLHRGRLPLQQIIRFSGLKPRTVRAAIIVLVQHNILWHAQSDAEGEVLEVNTDECLMRMRYGRYVWQAEQLYGKAVRTVSDLKLLEGFVP